MRFSESLRTRQDFSNVYEKGRSRANKTLVLYVRKNGLRGNRLGIAVSKKVGNSVVRHKIRRRVKEAYRLSEEQFVRGIDLVVIARHDAAGATYEDIRRALLILSRALGVWTGAPEEGHL